MAKFTPRKEISREIYCCQCCDSNLFLKNHSINLFGSKSSTEKIILHIERLTYTKIEENDGLSHIIRCSSYVKSKSYLTFLNTFNKGSVQQKSVVRFKRQKRFAESPSSAEETSPSGRHLRKNVKHGEENVSQACAPSKTRVFHVIWYPTPCIIYLNFHRQGLNKEQRHKLLHQLFQYQWHQSYQHRSQL